MSVHKLHKQSIPVNIFYTNIFLGNIIQKRFGGHVPTPTEARALAKKFGMTMDNLPVRAGDFKELNGAAQAQYTRYMLLGSLFMATSIYFVSVCFVSVTNLSYQILSDSLCAGEHNGIWLHVTINTLISL